MWWNACVHGQCHRLSCLHKEQNVAEQQCRSQVVMMIPLILVVVIMTLGSAIQDFLQSPYCATNCLQHIRWCGQGAVMCKSHATHQAVIMCNMPCASRDSSAIKFDRVQITFIWDLFDWLKPLSGEGGNAIRVPREKTPVMSLRKCHFLNPSKFKPQQRFEPCTVAFYFTKAPKPQWRLEPCTVAFYFTKAPKPQWRLEPCTVAFYFTKAPKPQWRLEPCTVAFYFTKAPKPQWRLEPCTVAFYFTKAPKPQWRLEPCTVAFTLLKPPSPNGDLNPAL